MKSLNVYLSGTEREKLIDVLNDYIHMVSTMYGNTGSEELEKLLAQLDEDLRPIFYKLYKGYNAKKYKTKKIAENACNKLYDSICNYIFKVVDEREEPGYEYVKNTID